MGHPVDDGPSWSGVDRAHTLELSPWRDDRDVSDTAKILKSAPIRLRREEHRVGDGNERRTLPSRRDITHPKIADHVDSSSLGDHRRFARLPGRVTGFVPNCLPV